MRNQTKYLFIYLCVLCLLVGSVIRLAQAQELTTEETSQAADAVELDQAELDQMLAPIALYPDTLLSHILVASTYPLEVIQAARWRTANEDLDEQQALDAVEDKDWDPSVKALVPFNQLLQNLSEDLDWLQALGNAFLVNEEQLLASVQNLRQRAYQQGNLTDNDYIEVAQEEDEIVIETVRKEVVYVPYYDTRVVYGNWWWHNHQPYFWHRPRHSVLSAGFYWSIGFHIRPSFYFGGFHWRNRHVVANYHYRSHANRNWSNNHNRRQVVRVKEYPRWSHNQQHRRGVKYKVNGQNIVHRVNASNKNNHYQQIDKKRVLQINDAKKQQKNNPKRIKQALNNQQQTARQTKTFKTNNVSNNKQRIINQSKNQQKLNRTNIATKQGNSGKSQKYAALNGQNSQGKRSAFNTQKKTTNYKSSSNSNRTKSSQKSSSYRSSSNKQSQSRSAKVTRSNSSQSRHK